METWEIDTDCNIIYYEKNGIRTDICKILQTDMLPDEANQKARLIVRACNSHDNMLKACLMALGYAGETSVLYNTLKAAISEAEKP